MGQTLPNIALTVAQLLQFNCFFRRHETNSNCGRHSKDRETPVPLYVGLSVHAQTRKRELVDTLLKLGISISYDRVLGISTEIGNCVWLEDRRGFHRPMRAFSMVDLQYRSVFSHRH